MTVLPNAPIDAATGLPVPTIAVGTAGGTSIIRDDGTVVDYTLGSYPTKNVEFDFDNNVLQSSRNIGSSGGALYVNKYPIISADSNSGTIQQELVLSSTAGDNTGGLDFVKTSFIEGTKNLVALKDSTLAFSSDAGAVQGIGVYQLGPEGTTKTTTLGAVITSSYATGWMNGDIKLATLSDTSTTNVTQGDQSTDAEDVGCGLISNGNFTDDVDDWTNDTGTASYYSTDSSMKIVQGSGTGFVYQGITTVVGKTYTLSFSAKGGNTNDVAFYIGTTTTGGTIISQSGITVSSSSYTPITGTFVATATTTYIRVSPWASATNFAYFDNISVRLAEDDRSVNANGLQVFGTVTKSIVATGADLVAYTGWSASNYLMQPYNADLDFGTGDCSLIFWADTPASGSDRIWFSHGTYNTAGSGFNNVQINSSGDGDTTNFNIGVSSAGTIAVGGIEGLGWQCWVLLRRNGIFQVYKNNVLQGSVANVTDIDLSSATINQLYVGTGYTTSVFGTGAGSLALWRMSATAPSPEQIAKIYEDEKFLFQAGAQSTLYDDTDAVTALAYDDATDLLHVGTADGRSTFQGLRRVANTTAAVSVAISASNGLVVED
jgi:hypothetical protein